ncbi:hypothetical protein SAMN05216201_109165 [Pseudomonas linyingensis]|uniref:Uncharacterized protein n=1 Tax=Pseudomonas linyingensis TaxID=915471 RepID=A0A1H6Z8S1_9PSED|nr:hypothetical protein SAMN05216201_109165 [Pseudomonas linyingensis]
MNNLRQYRGYYGSIETSAEDNCLFGKLLFIRELINYEGETVAELQAAFRELPRHLLPSVIGPCGSPSHSQPLCRVTGQTRGHGMAPCF